jgi:predicted esterase
LEELSILVDNPGRGESEQSLISEYYKEVTPLCHFIQSGNCPLVFNYTYESLFCESRVSFDKERQIKETEDLDEDLEETVQKNYNQ